LRRAGGEGEGKVGERERREEGMGDGGWGMGDGGWGMVLMIVCVERTWGTMGVVAIWAKRFGVSVEETG
jgi:hypothetical protein